MPHPVDLIVVNNQLLKALKKLKISEQESCSDHNIIKFSFGHDTEYNHNGHRYVVTDENLKKFDSNLRRIVVTNFLTGQEDSLNLDGDIRSKCKELKDIESTVDLFQEALISSCNIYFNIRRATKITTKYKSLPLRTEELTIIRKRINALRRRYQITTTITNYGTVAKISTLMKEQNIKQH